jgi:hypothetical protein
MSLRKLQGLSTSRGSACTEYIYSVWLEHAAFLIRRRKFLHTEELLSQISYRCGYQDHNYFARIFQRKFGQAPSAYAKSHCRQSLGEALSFNIDRPRPATGQADHKPLIAVAAAGGAEAVADVGYTARTGQPPQPL